MLWNVNCDVECGDVMWNDGVVYRKYYWWCALMQAVQCGCGIVMWNSLTPYYFIRHGGVVRDG